MIGIVSSFGIILLLFVLSFPSSFTYTWSWLGQSAEATTPNEEEDGPGDEEEPTEDGEVVPKDIPEEEPTGDTDTDTEEESPVDIPDETEPRSLEDLRNACISYLNLSPARCDNYIQTGDTLTICNRLNSIGISFC